MKRYNTYSYNKNTMMGIITDICPEHKKGQKLPWGAPTLIYKKVKHFNPDYPYQTASGLMWRLAGDGLIAVHHGSGWRRKPAVQITTTPITTATAGFIADHLAEAPRHESPPKSRLTRIEEKLDTLLALWS